MLRRGLCLISVLLLALIVMLNCINIAHADVTVDNSEMSLTKSTGSWSVSSGFNPFGASDSTVNSLWAIGGHLYLVLSGTPNRHLRSLGVAFGLVIQAVIQDHCRPASNHPCQRYNQRIGQPAHLHRAMEQFGDVPVCRRGDLCGNRHVCSQ
jgi:hypothetical protein